MSSHSTDNWGKSQNILFICTGNKYRSPSAEHILKTLAPNLNVKSAGTSENAAGNHLIAKKMRRCLVEMSYEEPAIKSQHVSRELMEWADCVIYMAPTHRKYLAEHFPEFMHKCSGLYEFTASGPNELPLTRIEDPAFIREHADVLEVTKIIERAVKRAREVLNF